MSFARSIVIVDDNAAVRDAIDFAFEVQGFHVQRFASAEDALDGAREAACYVVDYDLPGMNGIDYVRELRRTRPDVPAIMITGKSGTHVVDGARQAGIALLHKPLLGIALVDAVRNLIRA